VGGGFEIALAADIILMSESAYFELPEMQRGFLPDAGGIQRLPRRIPYNVAMEMILSGRRMLATEALSWGLTHKVVPSADLQAEALALAVQVAKGAPLALLALKEVMQAIDGRSLQEAMAMTRAAVSELPILNQMWKSADAKEGPRAFLEKRPPQWRGE
jgi:crotonobetainyl-CoA hydratase